LENGVCLNDGMKPIFISIGYKTTLDLAIKIAIKTTYNHRQPEPLCLAHFLSKQKIKELESDGEIIKAFIENR